MAGSWSLMTKVAQKKYDDLKESWYGPGERIDLHLPLGIRIGGMIDIPQPDFILAGDSLKIKHPGLSNIVLSYGVIPMGKSVFYRFYLQASKSIYMLELVTNERKDVDQCTIFMQYDEIFPDDWAFWLDDREGYIGYSVFQTKDNTPYFRVWEDPDRATILGQDDHGNEITRIPPVEFLENVYLDQYGKHQEMVKYDSMLYARQINADLNEFLLLSAVSGDDSASIQVMIGIPLEPVSLKVI
jgi:hypothetical protein